jgi:hypothetical protein
MGGTRFDSLTRSLSNTPSRRHVTRSLGGVAVGALGGLGIAGAGAGKKGKRKKKNKGGQCPECPPALSCTGQTDDIPCNGTGKCLAGVCNPRPTCNSGTCGPPSNTGDTGCCGGYCLGTGPTQPGVCRPGEVGHQCSSNAGCAQHNCAGYRCQKGFYSALCNAPDQCQSGVCTASRCA